MAGMVVRYHLDSTDGFVKLVTRKEDGVVIGAQIAGANASDIISEIGLAIEAGYDCRRYCINDSCTSNTWRNDNGSCRSSYRITYPYVKINLKGKLSIRSFLFGSFFILAKFLLSIVDN